MTPADIIVDRLEHTARQVLDTVTGCDCGTRCVNCRCEVLTVGSLCSGIGGLEGAA